MDDYKENIFLINSNTVKRSDLLPNRFKRKTTHLYNSDSFENAQMCQASH